MATNYGGGYPPVDYNLIASIGPNMMQGGLMRMKILAMEEERRKREMEAKILEAQMLGNQQIGDFLMRTQQGLPTLANNPLAAAELPTPQMPQMGPPPQMRPPVAPPPQMPPPVAQPPDFSLGAPTQVPGGGPMFPTSFDQGGPPIEEEERIGPEPMNMDPMSQAVNGYLNAPNQYVVLSALLMKSQNTKGAMEMYAKAIEEKKLRVDTIKTAMELIPKYIEMFGEEGVKVLAATYPFLRSVPPEVIEKAAGSDVDIKTDNYGNPVAIITQSRGQTDIRGAGDLEVYAAGVGKEKERAGLPKDMQSVTPEELLLLKRSSATNVNVGDKFDYDLAKENMKAFIGTLKPLQEEARNAIGGLQRLSQMEKLLDEGAGGKWGQIVANVAPYAEMFGMDMSKHAGKKAYEVIATGLQGTLRKELMSGQTSDYENRLLASINAGGDSGIDAARKIIKLYREGGEDKIRRYNSSVKGVTKKLREKDKDAFVGWEEYEIPSVGKGRMEGKERTVLNADGTTTRQVNVNGVWKDKKEEGK